MQAFKTRPQQEEKLYSLFRNYPKAKNRDLQLLCYIDGVCDEAKILKSSMIPNQAFQRLDKSENIETLINRNNRLNLYIKERKEEKDIKAKYLLSIYLPNSDISEDFLVEDGTGMILLLSHLITITNAPYRSYDKYYERSETELSEPRPPFQYMVVDLGNGKSTIKTDNGKCEVYKSNNQNYQNYLIQKAKKPFKTDNTIDHNVDSSIRTDSGDYQLTKSKKAEDLELDSNDDGVKEESYIEKTSVLSSPRYMTNAEVEAYEDVPDNDYESYEKTRQIQNSRKNQSFSR